MIKAMLTTVDNPHNPFDNFRAWFAWDVAAGYHSTALLAKIIITSIIFTKIMFALITNVT